MSNVGFIGLGKLGLPVALAIESKGHTVVGYDVNPDVAKYVAERAIPYKEKDLQPLLDQTSLTIVNSIRQVVSQSSIVFVTVQTPHAPEYEGATRIPADRKDFDYSFLISAIKELAEECRTSGKKKTVVVISTCLPGTFKRDIEPLLNNFIDYAYSPQFIAMGTVLEDYLNPEFNLIGVYSDTAAARLEAFFKTINDAPNVHTDVTTAEAIKVSYNTFITMKTVLANSWGELCHKLGANVDDVFKAWSFSDKRLLSPRYLKSGVGDGGGCHPRDNIALSYIAEQVGLSHNLFEDLMRAREDHMEWLADMAIETALANGLRIVVLGKAFKPETNIETGSPSVLLTNIIHEKGYVAEQYEELGDLEKAVYVIGTQHERFKDYKFPAGSHVIDPFRYIPNQSGVTVTHIGV